MIQEENFEKTDFKLGKLGVYYIFAVFGDGLYGGSCADKEFPDDAYAARREYAERIRKRRRVF